MSGARHARASSPCARAAVLAACLLQGLCGVACAFLPGDSLLVNFPGRDSAGKAVPASLIVRPGHQRMMPAVALKHIAAAACQHFGIFLSAVACLACHTTAHSPCAPCRLFRQAKER